MNTVSSPDIGARILSRETGKICFAVDAVDEVSTPLPVVPVQTLIQKRTSRKFYFVSPSGSVLSQGSDDILAPVAGLHPLVDSVLRAFNEHRALELTPDDFALVIAQGFSHHVNANPESLRGSLVAHEGKAAIAVDVEEWGSESAWEFLADAFSAGLREVVNPAAAEALRMDYSTTTKAARIAGEIALLSAFQRYFDYIAVGVCGIPRITLRGTVEDWRRLKERALMLGFFDLHWWTSRLAPILDQCIATAEGAPNEAFWKAIVKPRKTYGVEKISGWLADLFPYLTNGFCCTPDKRNPVLDIVRTDWLLPFPGGDPDLEKASGPAWRHPAQVKAVFDAPGIRPNDCPPGLAEAPVSLAGMAEGGRVLVGGFLGSVQAECGALRTELGWGLAEADDDGILLARLVKGEFENELELVRTGKDERKSEVASRPALLNGISCRSGFYRLFRDSGREWHFGDLGEANALIGGKKKRVVLAARRKDGIAVAVRHIDGPDETDGAASPQSAISAEGSAQLPVEPGWLVMTGFSDVPADGSDAAADVLPAFDQAVLVPAGMDLAAVLTSIMDAKGGISQLMGGADE